MDLRESLIAARAAARRLAELTGPERSRLLADFAAALARPEARQAVLAANARDMASAREEEAAGRLGSSLVKRLLLDDKKLDTTIDGIRQLADMPELVGRTLTHRALDHGLILKRVSCPLGVLGVVFRGAPRRPGTDYQSGLEEPAMPLRSREAARPAPATVPCAPWPRGSFRTRHRHQRDGAAGRPRRSRCAFGHG